MSRSIQENPFPPKLFGVLHLGEDLLSVLILLGMMAMPLIQALYRKVTGTSLIGLDGAVQQGTLLISMTGAVIAAREDRHLKPDTVFMTKDYGLVSRIAKLFSGSVSVGILLVLAYAGWLLVSTGMENTAEEKILGLPPWAIQAAIPAAFLAIAIRFVIHYGVTWQYRLGIVLLSAVIPLMVYLPAGERGWLMLPGTVALIGAFLVGAPIFILMGGLAALYFFIGSEGEISALIDIPDACYSIVTSPFLPAIPLFTAAGAILAHGKTSERLVALFRAMFGFLPGGEALAAAVLLGFFTTFTGASGVTILALGPLLMPLLMKRGYDERFSLGLMTSAGSLGMLFPPCLPVILIAVVLAQPIDKMFMAGVLPGVLLLVLILFYGVFMSWRSQVVREPFNGRALAKAIWNAKWEILLPVLVLGGIFGGYTTVVESAALTMLYAIVIEVVIHRDFSPFSGLRKALIHGVLLTGGVLIIIGLAKGFTQYLIDAMVAEKVAAAVQGAISEKWLFLLALNVLLLIVGCLMDIVSAIIVIVPLLAPMLAHYDIHPIHFGIIFLANLEIGFLTPPVGMNLFMASYTFNKPLVHVYRAVLPFILLWLAAVLLISYVPWFSLAFIPITFGP